MRHPCGIRRRRRPRAGPRTRRSATLVAQSTIELGGHCWLTSAQWTMALADAAAFDLFSDFLVRHAAGALSIAAYLTRQDLPRLVRARSRAD
ncbi:hypothetical protein [Nocardia niwae]|uniref:hypothetical protein n=1 Tax=Nocardia niwae TaxID=626084 RepID=UPI0033F3FDCB